MWVLEDQITIGKRDREPRNKTGGAGAPWQEPETDARCLLVDPRWKSCGEALADKTCGSWKTRSRSARETESHEIKPAEPALPGKSPRRTPDACWLIHDGNPAVKP